MVHVAAPIIAVRNNRISYVNTYRARLSNYNLQKKMKNAMKSVKNTAKTTEIDFGENYDTCP